MRHQLEKLRIDQIRSRLRGIAAGELLDVKLVQAGYLEQQRELYEDVGYTARESNLFQVRNGFPRIVERDLVPGVGDVHYSVSVAECKHFVVEKSNLLEQIRGVTT